MATSTARLIAARTSSGWSPCRRLISAAALTAPTTAPTSAAASISVTCSGNAWCRASVSSVCPVIGREQALLFAEEGAKVVVNDPGVAPDGSGRDGGVAAAVVDEVVARGGSALANTDRVDDWEGARRMVDTAIEAFGDLHAVVNNATVKADRAMVTMSEREFDDVVAVKLKGSFAVSGGPPGTGAPSTNPGSVSTGPS